LVAENEPIQNGQYDALFKIGALGYSYKYVAMLNASDVEHGNEFPGPPAERLLALFKH
jgi:hypothetical protein